MFKQLIRWILPFVAVLLIATVILFTTIVGSSHAASTPGAAQQKHHPVVNLTPTPSGISPDIYVRGG